MDAGILELLRSPAIRRFVAATREVPPGDYPFKSYLGFNFTSASILNCKVYAHYFRRLEPAEFGRFLPRTTEFSRYYDRWRPTAIGSTNQTGCAFATKMRAPDAEPSYQFHYRFPFTGDVFDWLGVPDDSRIDFRHYTMSPGLSFEYTGTEALAKRYFYVHKASEKARVAEKFDEPECRETRLLELTYTDRSSKVILWMESVERCRRYFRELHWPVLDTLIAWMASWGCVPMFPGVYEGGVVRAAYFFKFPHTSDDPFGDARNRHIDTLKELP